MHQHVLLRYEHGCRAPFCTSGLYQQTPSMQAASGEAGLRCSFQADGMGPVSPEFPCTSIICSTKEVDK